MLQLTCSKAEAAIAQAAAIYFKNKVLKSWDLMGDGAIVIQPGDRQSIRASLLQAIIVAPAAIR